MFYDEKVWRRLLKPSLGDPNPDETTISPEFVFVICTMTEEIPEAVKKCMHIVRVVDKQAGGEAGGDSSGMDSMEQVASMFGAAEVVRNSTQLVEAAFDGDLDEVKNWLDKGYHMESTDGRKHSALSEAAAQGHMPVVNFLLELGADANSTSDTGRTALWRAAFNGHFDMVHRLLEVGADPDCQDRVSMETAYDVSKTPELRELLVRPNIFESFLSLKAMQLGWDRSRTQALIENRRRVMMAKVEERIQTAAQREEYAKHKLRLELVEFAEAGNWTGIRDTLSMIAMEAEKAQTRPR